MTDPYTNLKEYDQPPYFQALRQIISHHIRREFSFPRSQYEKIRFISGKHCWRTVLDVGCGNGKQAAAYIQYGVNYTGVDISPSMLLAARKAHSDCRPQQFQHVDILDDAQFNKLDAYDVVNCCDMFMLIPTEQQNLFLHRLCNLVRPGGHLFFETDRPTGKVIDFITQWFTPAKYKEHSSSYHEDNELHYEYSLDTVCDDIRLTGMEISQVYGAGFLTSLFPLPVVTSEQCPAWLAKLYSLVARIDNLLFAPWFPSLSTSFIIIAKKNG